MATRIILLIWMLFMAVILSAQVRVTTTDRLFVREKAQIGTDTSKYFQTITDSISASSTHRQAPTAKAVYNLVSTSGGGGVSDGDKGDIDVASSGAVWTVDTGSITTVKIAANAVTVTEIANSAVTYAKMQDVSATDRLLGRDSGGAGSVEEISVGGGLEFSGSGSIRIAQQSATSGQVLKWNGTTWAPDDDATSAGATGHNIAENGTGVTQRDTLNFSDDQIDFTVSSTATSTDVSGKIAQGGATSGQVLKWNGSAWAPADDSTVSDGDKGDIDVTASGATWTVDTAAITAVKLNQMGASTGEYLRWTGSAWDPDSAKVVTDSYPIGGTGTASDPITFLPVGSTGQVFKWNGFFWAAGDDSNGIYSGSGTSNATVTTTGTFQIRDNDNDNVLSVGHGSPGYVDMYSQNAIGGYSEINMADGNTTIYVDTAASIKVRDYRGNAVGMEYYADYSNTLKANARSIPDVGTVRKIVSDSIAVAGDGNGIYDGNGTIPGSIGTLDPGAALQFKWNSGNNAAKIDGASGEIQWDSPNAGTSIYMNDLGVVIGDATYKITAYPDNLDVLINAATTQMEFADGYTNLITPYFGLSDGVNAAEFRIYEPSGSGNNYTGFKAAAMAGNTIYTLPTDTPSDGDVLAWHTGNLLSWDAASGGISDGDKGDIDVTSSGAVWTVDTAAITDVKVSDVSVSKLTSGNLAAGLAATLPNTSTTARINYNNSNSALLIDDNDNSATISSEDGEQYFYANNTNATIGSGTTKMEYQDGALKLYDSDATQSITIQPPHTDSLTTSYTLTLPKDDGTSGQYLKTDGSGALSWGTPAGGSSPSVITPSQITADQDDYSPTGWSTATIVRLSGDSGIRAITSMAAGSDGEEKRLINVGSYPIYFPMDHPDGTAANRITGFGKDFILFPGSASRIMYDGTSSRWRFLDQMADWDSQRGIRYHWTPGSVTAGDREFMETAALTSGTIASAAAGSTNPLGSFYMSTGSGSTNGYILYFVKNLLGFAYLSKAHVYAEWLGYVHTLSDETDSFTCEWQLVNNPPVTTLEPNSTIGIRYSHSINGGRFEGFSKDSGGTESTVDLGITVTASQKYKLRIEVDKSKTEARFYIDGVMSGRVTGNMPANQSVGFRTIMLKSAGTAARYLYNMNMNAGAIIE